MSWYDVWPMQRANRRRISEAERNYRARVRRNKTLAAVKASNARISAERTARAKQRRANVELASSNEHEDNQALAKIRTIVIKSALD